MVAPTAAAVRMWSKLDLGALGYADDESFGRLVARAVAALSQITGINLATVPSWQEPLVEQAIQGLAEQLAFQAQPDMLETLADFDLIQSFSAGAYSETRRSAEDAMKARMLNAWPWLNNLLWGLLTDDRRDYWEDFFSTGNAPAFAVTEVDWSAYERERPFGYPLPNEVMWGRDG